MSNKWQIVKLREVLRLDLDRIPIDASKSYPMVGVLSFGRGLFDREPIENGNTSYKYFYRLKAHHLVMSQLFGWEGALALSSDQFAGKFVSPQFPTFLCDETKLHREFLGWFIRRSEFWESLGSRASGMGDRRRTLNPEALFACEIPLPHLAEQRRILARIEELAGQINEARTLRQEIEYHIHALLLAAFKSIAAGAPRMPLGDVAPLVRRSVEVSQFGVYPELGIRSFGKGTFHKPALTGLQLGEKRLFRIEPGDLLFNNVFAWEGAIAVVKEEDNARFGSHRFITCLPKPQVATSHFLCFYFLTREGLAQIGEASPGGAGRNRTLGLDALSRIEVPAPPVEKQKWFDELFEQIEMVRRARAKADAELDALLSSTLEQAFKGDL
jgi:type I restriction enzyme S subunit